MTMWEHTRGNAIRGQGRILIFHAKFACKPPMLGIGLLVVKCMCLQQLATRKHTPNNRAAVCMVAAASLCDT